MKRRGLAALSRETVGNNARNRDGQMDPARFLPAVPAHTRKCDIEGRLAKDRALADDRNPKGNCNAPLRPLDSRLRGNDITRRPCRAWLRWRAGHPTCRCRWAS